MKKNFTRILACVIALVTAISVFSAVAVFASDDTPVYDGTSVSESLQGEGTEASPYLIANGADLKYFEQNAAATTGKYYKLTADIVWSNYTSASEVPTASNWTPVKFNGNFDGDGHYIAGLITVSTSNGVGFFSEAYGTIKNLTITDSYFKGKECVAGIVGIMQPASGDTPTSLEIVNCKNYATIDGETDVAGIIGKAFANAKTGQTKLNIVIKQCVNYGNIFGSKATVYAGGIGGRVYAYGTSSGIFECVNYGTIAPTNDKPCVVGGILAQTGINDVPGDGWSFTISDCLNVGNVSGYRIVGGIIGRNYANSTVKNCVNIGEISMSALNSGDSVYEGQFGAIAGVNGGKAGTATIENCFYVAGCAKNTNKADDVSLSDNLSTAKTAEELNSAAMATTLGDKWTYDALKGLTLVAFTTPTTPDAPGGDVTTTPDVTTTAPTVTTTAPVDTTTAPSGNEETTVPTGPADVTTTAPENNDTTAPEATTTEKPADETTATPDVTTQAHEKKGCGGVAGIAVALTVIVSSFGAAVIVKKN